MARKARRALFDPDVFLASVTRDRTKLEYRSEGVIFSQGDAANSIFYILRGKIKIVVTSKQGREAVVALLGEGDFFGEGCLIAQPLRLATAVSMTNATVMRVKKAEMVRLLHAEPEAAPGSRATSEESCPDFVAAENRDIGMLLDRSRRLSKETSRRFGKRNFCR